MNILFFCRGLIARQCFQLIISPEYTAALVVKAIVSSKNDYDTLNSQFLLSGIHHISNVSRNTNQIIDVIKTHQIDLLISVQHNWILPAKVLEEVGGFAFNLHNAKLPDYKGYNTITHSILNNESHYFTTIHWIDEEVDTGDIAYERSFPIVKNDTALSVYNKSHHFAMENFKNLLSDLALGNEIPRIKNAGNGKFYRRGDSTPFREIRCITDPEEVDRKSRAFFIPPYEPAYFILNGRKYHVSPNHLGDQTIDSSAIRYPDKT